MAALPIEIMPATWYKDVINEHFSKSIPPSPRDDLLDTVIAVYGDVPFLEREFVDFLQQYIHKPKQVVTCTSSTSDGFIEFHELESELDKVSPFSDSDGNEFVLVVGQQNWDEQYLVELVTMCLNKSENDKLNVYSQEMFLFRMMTGIDPFTSPPDVLLKLGSDHPALDFLLDWEFDWPSSQFVDSNVNAISDTILKDSDINRNFEYLDIELESDTEIVDRTDYSPASHYVSHDRVSYPDFGILAYFGYGVGEDGISDPRERKRILREVFEEKDLPELDGVLLEEWAEPRSQARLKKMANCLAFFVKSPRNQAPNMTVARNRWKLDLEWLKEEFYKAGSFRWPTTVW